MHMYEWIKRKRDGHTLDRSAIDQIIAAYSLDEIPSYQMSALLMAIYFKGMETEELAHWTRAMIGSGEQIHFDAPGPYVDKHSTGGVGDKISLPLAPLAAELGVKVPMISGRGLGHTGGTLDKLDSIPGFTTDLDSTTFKKLVDEVGCCIIGQTANLVPADKRLYALRDVTATVDSIPLIASSILSKKTASGIRGLLMDVKCGAGAFMKTRAEAEMLAKTLVALGAKLGLEVRAYVTNMNQPLGRFVGNALEVRESIEILKNQGPTDTTELTVEFAAAMAVLAGTQETIEDARIASRRALESGAALNRFVAMLKAQGGDTRIVDDPGRLPRPAKRFVFNTEKAGTLQAVDSEGVGRSVVQLGGGRNQIEDPVDPAVGLEMHCRVGDQLKSGDPVATLFYNDDERFHTALETLKRAFMFTDDSVAEQPLIFQTVDANSL